MKTYRRPHETWHKDARLDRWHRIWIATLDSQTTINPNLPDGYRENLLRYRNAADEFRDSAQIRSAWWDNYELHLQACRHEVVAALRTFNQCALGTSAHLGLTSCDITETANQWAIRESLVYVHHRTCQIARLIADQATLRKAQRMVARTHGQPAQLTTLGYRYVTLLEPLNEWVERYAWYIYEGYRNRPMAGAVGTWADQSRVLTGWEPAPEAPTMPLEATGSASEVTIGISTPEGLSAATEWLLTMGDQMAARLRTTAKNPDVVAMAVNFERIRQETSGNEEVLTRRVSSWDTSYPGDGRPDVSELIERFVMRGVSRTTYGRTSVTSRQIYHRSADLHWMGLLAELASIAQTWATDRRLESMMGLGAEVFTAEQIGSSAMPHKQNPRFSERICGLAAITRSHLTAFAELASQEWLEGDVSGSAARRKLLADAFENIDALLCNWAWLIQNWVPNQAAIDGEVDRYSNQMATGALIQAAIEAPALGDNPPMTRDEAHAHVRDAFQKMAGTNPADFLDSFQLAFVLADYLLWPLTEDQTRGVIDAVATDPIGDIDTGMDSVIATAVDRHQFDIDWDELGRWLGELR